MISRDNHTDSRGADPLRVCMPTYSFYESDGRVRRYAETLAARGDIVEVLSLRRRGQGSLGELNGVRIHRLQERVRDEKGKEAYFIRVLKFFFRSAELLSRGHLRRPYDLVHVHSVPDFEVFAAIVPRFLGARVILDIHDIVPELYRSKFGTPKNSAVFKLLVWMEKASIAFSDHTFISNDLWRERLISRSARPGKCTALLNFPDPNLFYPRSCPKRKDKIILMYPGTLNHHQGLDISVRAFGRIKESAPEAEFHIYGEGPARAELFGLIRSEGLEGRVLIKGQVPLDEIVCIMADADIGVIPKKDDEFGGEAFSTKTLEFMSLGVPIILSRTRIDRGFFDPGVVRFFQPGNPEDLAAAMLELIRDKKLRERLAVRGQEFAARNSWEAKKHIYLDLVDRLTKKR